MTRSQKFEWWLYCISAVILFFFLAPALISAADTLMVLLGVILIVIFAVWSWHLWITKFWKLLKDSFYEL